MPLDHSPDERLAQVAAQLGFPLQEEIKIGGRYVPASLDGDLLWVSGQIPRVGDQVRHVGVLGGGLAVADGQQAAAICALRVLALMQRSLGSLVRVQRLQRISVYVRCCADFTQHSEVADGASEVFQRVLGEAGAPTRTSVGVLQLPKGAAVELDAVARILPMVPQ